MQYVTPIKNLKKDGAAENGGKAANLGEMAQNGFNVPGGFCVAGKALDYLLEAAGLLPEIQRILVGMDFNNYDTVEKESERIRTAITDAPIPGNLESEIKKSIEQLSTSSGEEQFVAVRSSVSVKDSDITSFPGMMDTYHFIKGQAEIVQHIKRCWASLFTARAIYRRHQQKIPQDKGVIAPIVQKMVNSEVAGVLFTANPVTGARDEIVVEANWGLGESLVSGEAIVDYFTLSSGDPPAVKQKKIMKKNIIVTIDKERGIGRKKYKLTGGMVHGSTLTDEQLVELGTLGQKAQEVFQCPQMFNGLMKTASCLYSRPVGLRDSPTYRYSGSRE